jgi:hypothetical protein
MESMINLIMMVLFAQVLKSVVMISSLEKLLSLSRKKTLMGQEILPRKC